MNQKTILIVDDDKVLLEALGDIVEIYDYKVLLATSGLQALEVARGTTDRIDLLLTDVKMPGMNGPELAKELAATHPETRILFMSGYTKEFLRQYNLNDVDVDFLVKPILEDNLIPKIRDILN